MTPLRTGNSAFMYYLHEVCHFDMTVWFQWTLLNTASTSHEMWSGCEKWSPISRCNGPIFSWTLCPQILMLTSHNCFLSAACWSRGQYSLCVQWFQCRLSSGDYYWADRFCSSVALSLRPTLLVISAVSHNGLMLHSVFSLRVWWLHRWFILRNYCQPEGRHIPAPAHSVMLFTLSSLVQYAWAIVDTGPCIVSTLCDYGKTLIILC